MKWENKAWSNHNTIKIKYVCILVFLTDILMVDNYKRIWMSENMIFKNTAKEQLDYYKSTDTQHFLDK